jgi:hypothetical protein
MFQYRKNGDFVSAVTLLLIRGLIRSSLAGLARGLITNSNDH